MRKLTALVPVVAPTATVALTAGAAQGGPQPARITKAEFNRIHVGMRRPGSADRRQPAAHRGSSRGVGAAWVACAGRCEQPGVSAGQGRWTSR